MERWKAMSIRVQSAVWERSQAKGSALLLLLAIADFADDDGHAYPSLATLAEKTRLSERNVRYVLREVEALGELSTSVGDGKHGCNLYRILPPAKIAPGNPAPEGGQSSAEGGATHCPRSVIDPSVDPSTLPQRARAPKKPPIREMTPEEMHALIADFPDFDVGAELLNCRNIKTWATTYVSEYGALRNRLRLKRKDITERRNQHGNGNRPSNGTSPAHGPVQAGHRATPGKSPLDALRSAGVV